MSRLSLNLVFASSSPFSIALFDITFSTFGGLSGLWQGSEIFWPSCSWALSRWLSITVCTVGWLGWFSNRVVFVTWEMFTTPGLLSFSSCRSFSVSGSRTLVLVGLRLNGVRGSIVGLGVESSKLVSFGSLSPDWILAKNSCCLITDSMLAPRCIRIFSSSRLLRLLRITYVWRNG